MAQGNPDIRVLVGVANSAADGKSGDLIRSDLKKIFDEINKSPLKIRVQLDIADLQKQVQSTQSKLSTKIKVGYSVDKSSSSEWDKIFKQSIKDLTAKNVDLDPLTNYYKVLERQSDAFNRKNLNGIDFEIKAREKQGKAFSAQLKQQMQEAAALEKQQMKIAAASAGYSTNAQKLLSDMNQYLRTVNPSALKELNSQISDFRSKANLAAETGLKKDFDTANISAKTLKASMKDLGAEGGNVFTYIQGKVKTFATYLVSSTLTMAVVGQLRAGIQTIHQLDSALTTINMTMPMTRGQLNRLGDSAIDMARELGASVNGVLSVAQIYANMNETANSIMEKSRPTLLLSTASGLNASTSADVIQGALYQFGLAKDKAMEVSDIFQKVSANMGVEFGKGIIEIADAISTAGAVAKTAGMDLKEFTATVGMLEEKTRLSGSTVANTLKMVAARTFGASTEDASAEEVSKADEALQSIGIHVRDTNNEFRAWGEVMGELAKKWSTLNSVQKSFIAETLAGNRQRSTFIAYIEDYDRVMELQTEANNAVGFSLETNKKYLESFDAKAQQISASMGGIWASIVDTTFFKGAMDGINGFLGGLNSIVSAGNGAVGTILTLSVAIFTLTTAFDAIKASSLGASITSTIASITSFIPNLVAEGLLIQGIATAKAGEVLSTEALTAATTRLSAAKVAEMAVNAELDEHEMLEILRSAQISWEKKKEIWAHYKAAVAKTTETAATAGLTISIKALALAVKEFLLTNPVGWFLMAATAIAGFVALVDACTTSLDEQTEIVEKLRGEYSSIQSEINQYNQELEETQSRILELQRQGPLSFTEQEELDRLLKQNKYLDTQIKLKERLRTDKAVEANAALKQEFEMDYGNGVEHRSLYQTSEQWASKGKSETVAAYVDSEVYYQELLQKVRELSASGDNSSPEYQKYSKELRDLATGYSDFAKRLNVVDSESQQLYNDWMELATTGINALNGIFWSSNTTSLFDQVWNNDELEVATQKLTALGLQGKVTAEMLSDPAYADFIQALEDIGVLGEDSGVSMEELASHINSATQAANAFSDTTADLATDLKAISTSQGVIDDIKTDIDAGGKLSLKTLQQIIDTYDDVEGAVRLYSAGILESADILALVEDKYDEDVEAYGKSVVAKSQMDQSFYAGLLKQQSRLNVELSKKYDINLNDYKTLAEAKLGIEAKLVTATSQMWLAFYDAQANTLNANAERISRDLGRAQARGDSWTTGQQELADAIGVAQDYARIVSELERISVDYSTSGLDFNSQSSKSKNAVDEYKVKIDALYESSKRLADLQDKISLIDKQNALLDDKEYQQKISHYKDLIRLRQQENGILHEQNNIRRGEIQKGIDQLTKYGIKVDYTPESNDLLIQNRGLINDIWATSGKLEDTNALRKELEKLVDDILKLNDDARETSLDWHDNLVSMQGDTDNLINSISDFYESFAKDKQHSIDLMVNQGGQTNQIIAEYYTLMDTAHIVADEIRKELRDLGWSEVAIESSDAVQELSDAYCSYYREIQELQQDRLDSLNEELDLVKEMVKQEKEDEIDALEAQKDKFSDIIELKKKSLDLTERDRSYQENINDINSEIKRLRAKADLLDKDGSRAANIERGNVLEELAKKQKELADQQRDHSIESQKDALEQEQDDFENAQDKKIKEIKDFLADNQKLTQAAMDRIEQNGESLFDQLRNYALHYTQKTELDLVSMWDKAKEAAEGYRSFTEALINTEREANRPSTNGTTTGNSDVSQNAIVSQMKRNSELWYTASPEKQAYLVAQNEKLAKQLKLDPSVDKRDGRWYWPDSNIPVYHTGGKIGATNPRSDELYALLKKKEFVLTEEDRNAAVALLKSAQPQFNIPSILTSALSKIAAQSQVVKSAANVAPVFNLYPRDYDDFVAQFKKHGRELGDILAGQLVKTRA